MPARARGESVGRGGRGEGWAWLGWAWHAETPAPIAETSRSVPGGLGLQGWPRCNAGRFPSLTAPAVAGVQTTGLEALFAGRPPHVRVRGALTLQPTPTECPPNGPQQECMQNMVMNQHHTSMQQRPRAQMSTAPSQSLPMPGKYVHFACVQICVTHKSAVNGDTQWQPMRRRPNNARHDSVTSGVHVLDNHAGRKHERSAIRGKPTAKQKAASVTST